MCVYRYVLLLYISETLLKLSYTGNSARRDTTHVAPHRSKTSDTQIGKVWIGVSNGVPYPERATHTLKTHTPQTHTHKHTHTKCCSLAVDQTPCNY